MTLLSLLMDEPEGSPASSPGESPQLAAQEPDLRSTGRPTESLLPSALLQAHRTEAFHSRPRNRSPYPRSHLRSYSAASALAAPPMARTRSLPNPAANSHISPSHSPVRPSSPMRSPAAMRPSPRRSFEDAHSQSAMSSFMDIESIAEDSELDITPRRAPPADYLSSTVPFGPTHTYPRSSSSSRRRPVSPLHSSTQSPVPPTSPLSSFSTPASLASPFNEPSPSTTPPPPPSTTRFNEVYPVTTAPQLSLTTPTAYSNSSMPSTPTSLRSRSPSISSLETIPDSPDAEEAAMEAFNIARLRAAAEAAESAGSDSDGEGKRTRTSPNLTTKAAGPTDKNRKRWSVCGAERRGDFEMETIWED